MAARSIDTIDRQVRGVHPVTGSAARARRHLLRHRLVVVAPDMIELVRFAGGWLFDRAMAGWDTTVLVADPSDIRPLQILGVHVVDLEAAMASTVRSPQPNALAVAASLYSSDADIRHGLNTILNEGSTDVLLWGDEWPTEIDCRLGSVRYRLSDATRAFKAQALAAAAAPLDSIGVVETFRSTELASPPFKTA